MALTGYGAAPHYDDEWVVVGSGPSGKQFRHICDGRKVATVNAGISGGEPLDVDAYGVFELEAFPQFKERYKSMIDSGVECFTRRSIEKTYQPGGRAVPLTAGYNQSSDAIGISFCSAGCAMLNAVAFHHKPRVIHMIGFDGYEGDDKFTRTRNSAMSRHIEAITRTYRHIQFVLHGISNLPNQQRWIIQRRGVI